MYLTTNQEFFMLKKIYLYTCNFATRYTKIKNEVSEMGRETR